MSHFKNIIYLEGSGATFILWRNQHDLLAGQHFVWKSLSNCHKNNMNGLIIFPLIRDIIVQTFVQLLKGRQKL